MVIYLKKEDMPKNCGECPCCYYFEKDAHGKANMKFVALEEELGKT